ncbi:MAG: DUF3347 domain-containing protein [Deltaproteobacteria bacterium]|nr:DUF3347 domain-containing protein [Deltaproteobacteria bacterium]MCB9789235.1 DUF3347 domain-containing protein [Deltaproteobacteria bacterium]
MLSLRPFLLSALTAGLLVPAPVALADDSPSQAIAAAYETARAALADDDFAHAKAGAAALTKAAKVEPSEGHLGHHYEPIAKAAATFADAKDIEAARLIFGEISKAFIGLVAADKHLGRGLHAFTCPMAKGYKKWVQTTEKVANPYMGKTMGQCGSKTEMQP